MDPAIRNVPEIEDLIESYLSRHYRTGYPVYTAVLLLVIVLLVLLPVVHVDVRVRSPGVIRPTSEVLEIRSPVSSPARAVLARRGDDVAPGQRLFLLGTNVLDQRTHHLRARKEETLRRIADVERLSAAEGAVPPPIELIRSPEYRRDLALLIAEIEDHEVRRDRAAISLDRVRRLHTMELTSLAEVEQAEFDYRQLRVGLDLLLARYASRWSSELTRLRQELETIQESLGVLSEEAVPFIVETPIGGTVEELASVLPGGYVHAGDLLAVVSPDAPLRAEIYVASADVGLLRVGMPVRLLIDAFSHFDWGAVDGRVTRIASDYLLMDQQPVFRVEASLDRTHLDLPNGVRGELRKGMSLQGQFVLARRSLLQLLRDGVADWLDPEGTGALSLRPAAGA